MTQKTMNIFVLIIVLAIVTSVIVITVADNPIFALCILGIIALWGQKLLLTPTND